MGEDASQAPLIVLMGVSGSGKSSVGVPLAERLGVPYIDGDDLHPQANVDKMHAGHPLTDDDRWPWLAAVGKALSDAEQTGLVIACSALKRSYRQAILAEEPAAFFVHLDAPEAVIAERVADRHGHFMPASLLHSQFETLEPLADDEPGVVVDVTGPVDRAIEKAVAALP